MATATTQALQKKKKEVIYDTYLRIIDKEAHTLWLDIEVDPELIQFFIFGFKKLPKKNMTTVVWGHCSWKSRKHRLVRES